MLKYSYWLWDHAVSKEFCDLVMSEVDWNKKQQGGFLDNSVDSKLRITDIVWLDPLTPVGCVAFTYINCANKLAGWHYQISSMNQIQIGKYENLGHYDWHIDADKPDLSNTQRKLSISIQLNDPSEYEGGKLEFQDLDEEQQPKMAQGSIIVFPSFLKHRVTPVTSGVRYSAVTWASGPAFM